MRLAIYPGSFDPITYGHLDVLTRALSLFDEVIVAISQNQRKSPLFSVEERIDMIQASVQEMECVKVDYFDGLLVQYAQNQGAVAIIRGLRAITDFEIEFQMALMNRHMNHDLTTVFLMPHERYTHLNSSIIREIAGYGGDVSEFVPAHVVNRLKSKYEQE